jgi:hypothetical protein
MNTSELSIILKKHDEWLKGINGGERANLSGADLSGANLDFSSWPLWCGSLNAKIDDRLTIQLVYHLLRAVSVSDSVSDDIKTAIMSDDLINIANKFHRVEECGSISK